MGLALSGLSGLVTNKNNLRPRVIERESVQLKIPCVCCSREIKRWINPVLLGT